MYKKIIVIMVSFGLCMLATQYAKAQEDVQTVESNEDVTTVGNPSTASSGTTATTSSTGFVNYCQGDPRWGAACGMAYAGCGPTTMAMIVTAFGEPITPPDMDRIFQQRSWRGCSANSPSQMPTATTTLLREKGYTVKNILNNIGNPKPTPLDLAEAKTYLDAKYLIIGSTANHIFVIDSVNVAAGTVHLQDPDNLCKTPSGYDSPNDAPWRGERWYYAYAVRKDK